MKTWALLCLAVFDVLLPILLLFYKPFSNQTFLSPPTMSVLTKVKFVLLQIIIFVNELSSSTDCEFYTEDIIDVSSVTQSPGEINIIDRNLEIQFDIKHDSSTCDSSLCQIFYIGDNTISFASLFYSPDDEIYVMNIADNYFNIPGTDVMTDGVYHNIYLQILSEGIFNRVDYEYPHYQYNPSSPTISKNITYPLYFGNSWNSSSSSIDGSIKNVCIKSANRQFINCQDTKYGQITSTVESSPVNLYSFNSSGSELVIFSSCNSNFSTVLFLYHINNDEIIQLSRGEGICEGNQAQLFASSLAAGEYILGILCVSKVWNNFCAGESRAGCNR